MRRRSVIYGGAAALTLAGLPRGARADARAALSGAFEACQSDVFSLDRTARALRKAGWSAVTDPDQLAQAAGVLGDSLAVTPLPVPGGAARLSPLTRRQSRAALRNNVETPDRMPFRSQTLARPDAGGTAFVFLRQAARDGALWCAAATTDDTAGRAFFSEVWPDAPGIPPGEPFLQAGSRARQTPLLRPAFHSRVTLTAFDRAAVETRLAAPFEAAAGFLIVLSPLR